MEKVIAGERQRNLLHGSHDLTVDEKNRLLIPAEVRKGIDPARDGEGFFAIVGINQKLWFYTTRYYEDLVAGQKAEITPDDDLLAFDQMHFAMTFKVEWDKQGRCVIPEKLIKRTGTEKEVTLIGVRDHFELWNRAAWEAREVELNQRRVEIAMKAKEARRSEPPAR